MVMDIRYIKSQLFGADSIMSEMKTKDFEDWEQQMMEEDAQDLIKMAQKAGYKQVYIARQAMMDDLPVTMLTDGKKRVPVCWSRDGCVWMYYDQTVGHWVYAEDMMACIITAFGTEQELMDYLRVR